MAKVKKILNVLIGCELSGKNRDAFIKRGHNAISCDLLPTEGDPANNHKHYMGDVLKLIHLPERWDLAIFHPDCTYVTSSGLHWNNKVPGREAKTKKAVTFARKLLKANAERIVLENPIGRLNTAIRPPDCYIHPWQYGHDASKKTGLWLKNLPPLKPTKIIAPRLFCCSLELEKYQVWVSDDKTRWFNEMLKPCPVCKGEKRPKYIWGNQTPTGQNKLGPSDDRAKIRSDTYAGWSNAFARQYG